MTVHNFPTNTLLLRISYHKYKRLEFGGGNKCCTPSAQITRGWGDPPGDGTPLPIVVPGTITALLVLSPLKKIMGIEQISYFNAYPPPLYFFANLSTVYTTRVG